MRIKRSASGRLHRSSLLPPSATASRPLPPPNTDDISDGSGNCDDRMEVQNSSESDDNVSGFSDDELIDDFDEQTCLECDKGERLLSCCGIGCPIALHEECIFGQPRYDEGKFHCPYCWYKLQQNKKEEWRIKVMLAKKDLSTFINFRPKVASGDKETQNNKRAKNKDLIGRKIISETNQSEPANYMVVYDEVQNVAREVAERGQNYQHNEYEKDEGNNADEEREETLFHGFRGSKSETSKISERKDQVSMKKGEQLRHVKQRSQKAGLPKQSTFHSHTYSTKATRKLEEVAPLKRPRQIEMPAKELRDPLFVHENNEGMLWKPENEAMLRNDTHELEGGHQRNSKLKYPCNNRSKEAPECEKTLQTPAHGTIVGMEHEMNDKHNNDENDEGTKANEEHVEKFTAQCEAEKTVVDGAIHDSPGAKSEIANKSQRGQVIKEKEEQLNKEATTASVCSSIEDKALNGPEVLDSETKSYIAQLRHVKQINLQNVDSPKNSAIHSNTSSINATRKSVDEFSQLKMPKKPEIPSIKCIDLPFAHEKRKRILWKIEEEEMLREGVHKFSSTKNKYISWRQILEFGRHIFDPSRTPTDLKDKWKKLAKES